MKPETAEWKDVRQGLPPPGLYLVSFGGHDGKCCVRQLPMPSLPSEIMHVQIGGYCDDESWYACYDGYAYPVTHWRPLPESPEATEVVT